MSPILETGNMFVGLFLVWGAHMGGPKFPNIQESSSFPVLWVNKITVSIARRLRSAFPAEDVAQEKRSVDRPQASRSRSKTVVQRGSRSHTRSQKPRSKRRRSSSKSRRRKSRDRRRTRERSRRRPKDRDRRCPAASNLRCEHTGVCSFFGVPFWDGFQQK